MDGVNVDRRATAHGQQSTAETVVDLSYWAWGGKGITGVDERLRAIATDMADFKEAALAATVEQKKRDRLLGLAILGGVVLANPLTAHLAEPWLRTFGGK